MRSARSSGRSPWRASWKTRFCICGTNEAAIGVVLFRTEGNAAGRARSTTIFSRKANGDWLVREIRHYLKRVLKRVDVTAKSLIALIEPGICFAGTLAELPLPPTAR